MTPEQLQEMRRREDVYRDWLLFTFGGAALLGVAVARSTGSTNGGIWTAFLSWPLTGAAAMRATGFGGA